VEKKKAQKGKVLTAEDIKAADNPLRLLLATVRQEPSTREVMCTHVAIPLSLRAQTRPYLAMRSVLTRVTGHTPLNITLIHTRKAMVFWDVTDYQVKTKILKTLEDPDFFRFPAEEGEVADHHFLRAYLGGYFDLLRYAVIAQLTPERAARLFAKAEEHWRKSPDKIQRRIWLRRIAADRKGLEEGKLFAPGERPSLDPDGVVQFDPGAREVTSLKWINTCIYILREQRESRERDEAEARRVARASERALDRAAAHAELAKTAAPDEVMVEDVDSDPEG
jgi:hypothetical protein